MGTIAPRKDGIDVLLGSPRGFCAGVVRAIDIVELCLQRFGSPVYVRHEIVHNPYVVESLRRKGAVFVEEVDEVPADQTLVFSAHGVSPALREEAREGRAREHRGARRCRQPAADRGARRQDERRRGVRGRRRFPGQHSESEGVPAPGGDLVQAGVCGRPGPGQRGIPGLHPGEIDAQDLTIPMAGGTHAIHVSPSSRSGPLVSLPRGA